MRLLLFFFVYSTGNSFGQTFQKYNNDTLPVAYWSHEVLSTDTSGRVAAYIRTEGLFDESDAIITKGCDKTTISISYNISPKHCIYWTKTDSTMRFQAPDGSIPDSIGMTDFDCLKYYLIDNKDSLNIDTIYADKIDYSKSENQDYSILRKTEYLYDKKHGYEMEYYSLNELCCCVKKNFRLKSKGRWKNGKKHGKWKTYNTEGLLTTVIIYRNGELLRKRTKND